MYLATLTALWLVVGYLARGVYLLVGANNPGVGVVGGVAGRGDRGAAVTVAGPTVVDLPAGEDVGAVAAGARWPAPRRWRRGRGRGARRCVGR